MTSEAIGTSEAFDYEKRRAFFNEKAVDIAWHAAANAAALLGGAKVNSLGWPACAADGKVDKGARAALAACVRTNLEVPPHALFRYASACGDHKIERFGLSPKFQRGSIEGIGSEGRGSTHGD
jgi:hypothetical protein